MLDKAIALAIKAHEGRSLETADFGKAKGDALHAHDKGGNPYIDHSLRVMNNVETVEEKIVAVLHDAVEDSDLSLKDLRAEGFSEVIVEAIAAITKQEGEKRNDYLKRVMDNPLSLKVKIADMSDNADISRIPNPTDRDRERTRIYKKNILKLEKKLQEYV